jgi:RNA polymerase sigma-70 factor (ECF subfamily)
LQFHSFDDDYLRRLAEGDAVVEAHFAAYFGKLLSLKLRARIRSPQLIEDIRQETLFRALQILRKKGGVEHPERFGGFINSVCNNVLMEMVRAEQRHDRLEPENDPADETVDLDAPLVNLQRQKQVETVLEELSAKDRDLLRMFFLEERDKSEICKRLQVNEDYFRVLLYRAKSRFRALYVKRDGRQLH